MNRTRNKIIARGKAHFAAFIESKPTSTEKPLPLTHTTDAFDLRDIVADQELKTRYCGVFGEDLSYCFYGRPAYRKNAKVQANSLAAYAPVILILKPVVSPQAIAAFPFDSGAFKDEQYSEFIHHRMTVEDFGLDPSFETIGKIVAFFFGNNKRYYDQLPNIRNKIGANEFEAQSLKEIVTYRGKNERDDRSSTIEVIFDKSINLRDNLLCIVVPASFLKDKTIKLRLASLGAHVRTYTDGANLTPASQIPRLSDVVRHFYLEQKIIKK